MCGSFELGVLTDPGIRCSSQLVMSAIPDYDPGSELL